MELAGETSPTGAGTVAIARFLQSINASGNSDANIATRIVADSTKVKSGSRAPDNWATATQANMEGLLTTPANLRSEKDTRTHFLANVNAAYSLPSMKIVARLDTDVATAQPSRAEIIAYHAASKSSFHIVAATSEVERIDLSALGTTALASPVTTSNLAIASTVNVKTGVETNGFVSGGINSVAISGNLMAVAVESSTKSSNGRVAFYTLSSAGAATFHSSVEVGVLPDSLAFSPDGKKLVVANEGEMFLDTNNALTDPEGSISVITITNGVPAATATTLSFADFNVGGSRRSELPTTLRIGQATTSTVAQDIEPEYVAISPDSTQAFVTLQENNGIAVVDLSGATPRISKIYSAGFQDHSLARNAIAPSDAASPTLASLKTYANLYGVRMPDGIAAFAINGTNYFITANEGDDRDDFLSPAETAKVSTLTLDATAFPNASTLTATTELGNLKVLTTDTIGLSGNNAGAGGATASYDKLYVLGGRSFTIYNAATGAEVSDSGSDIDRMVISDALDDATNSATLLAHKSIKKRLDNKGAEPESVVVGTVGSNTFAFVALERASAIMMYLINDPTKPKLVQYLRNTATLADANGDISPEGLKFIPASESPNGKALLLVGYEVSGTVSVIQID